MSNCWQADGVAGGRDVWPVRKWSSHETELATGSWNVTLMKDIII